MIHEGQLLRDLVKKLKAENGMSRSDVAQKIGITPEHLSTVFNREKLTAEIKTGAIEGLNLPPDFFRGQPSETEPPTDWQAEAARLDAELRSIKDRYIALLEKVNAEKEDENKEKVAYVLRSK